MMLRLESDAAALELASDDSAWCQVALVTSDARIALGAETLDYIVEHLLRALGALRCERSDDTVDGVRVAWVLSLMERHASMYVGAKAERRIGSFRRLTCRGWRP